MLGVGEEVLRGAFLDDGAVVEEQHPVGHLSGEAHLVGNHDRGHLRQGQLLDHVEHLFDHLRVEGGGRLVEQHYLGVHGQRPGDGHPLLLAARQLAGVLVGLLGDAHPFQQTHRRLLGLGPGLVADPDRRQGDVGQHGQVGEEVELLEHHSDLPSDGVDVAQVLGELDPVHHDPPLLVFFEVVDAADEGRFARSRRADHHHHLAVVDGAGHPVQRLEVAEPFADVLAHDGRVLSGCCAAVVRAARCHIPAPSSIGWFDSPTAGSLDARGRAGGFIVPPTLHCARPAYSTSRTHR